MYDAKDEKLQPWELQAGHKYHVFLSYRSVNRAWVLALYDALTERGFKVFLDQFVLVPGASLVSSLNDALSESAAGIIVYSGATDSSAWCKGEADTFVTRGNSEDGFRFVVALLDNAKLPALLATRLFESFAESPDGPSGVGLERLVAGICGQPPSPAVVRNAAILDQATKDAALDVKAAKSSIDPDALIAMADAAQPAWAASARLWVEAAQALISMKKLQDALDMLYKAEGMFPKSVQIKQCLGLAYRRNKQWREAQRVFSRLEQAGEINAETLGPYAATWMQRFEAENNPLYLRKSRDLYAKAFELQPSDYYVGINAASKSLLLDDRAAAQTYAAAVERLLDPAKSASDYWAMATLGEVQLIRRNYQQAADYYLRAVAIEPGAVGDHDSTWGQARKLMDVLLPSAQEHDLIAAAFSHLS